jgi:hypothetical protein
LAVLEFELRASFLKHSTTWATPPNPFCFSLFFGKGLSTFAPAGLVLPGSWAYRWHHIPAPTPMCGELHIWRSAVSLDMSIC